MLESDFAQKRLTDARDEDIVEMEEVDLKIAMEV